MKWVKQKHSEESNKSVPTTDGCTINHIINGYLVLGITGITFICQCTMVPKYEHPAQSDRLLQLSPCVRTARTARAMDGAFVPAPNRTALVPTIHYQLRDFVLITVSKPDSS